MGKRSLRQSIAKATGRGQSASGVIDAVGTRRIDLEQPPILEEWSAVGRRHADEAPGTPAWHATEFELDVLRRAYQDTIELAQAAGRPEPPPFPHERRDAEPR